MTRLVIVGGGFAGIWAAMSAAAERDRLKDTLTEILLLSRDGFLTLRPRLYEPLSKDFRVPIAPLMKEIGVGFSIGDVVAISEKTKDLTVAEGQVFSYDRLVLATGSQLNRPKIPGAEYCFSMDSWEAAESLNRHFEVEPEKDAFVVVGASFTGLEIATELRRRFGEDIAIHLIDRDEASIRFMGGQAQPHIDEALEAAGIQMHIGCDIQEFSPEGVQLGEGSFIASKTIILATGIRASSLTEEIQGDRDSLGRLMVDGNLKVRGTDGVYAAGDTSHAYADEEHVALMSCQHAIQLGRFVGHNAMSDLLGEEGIPYRQEIYRTCLDLGNWGALFTVGWDPEVQAIKDQGKEIKQNIVSSLIYPPSPDKGAQEIYKEISLLAEEEALQAS